jgi:hypothetical protein
MRVYRRRVCPLSPQNPRLGHPVPTKPMIRLQPAHTLVENGIPKSESTVGRFDPENSERTVCLDHGPRDGILLATSTAFLSWMEMEVRARDPRCTLRLGMREADWMKSVSVGLNGEMTHRPGFWTPVVGGVLDGGASCGSGGGRGGR